MEVKYLNIFYKNGPNAKSTDALIFFCFKFKIRVKLKNSSPKICWSSLGRLLTNSSLTDNQQLADRLKPNSGQLSANSQLTLFCLNGKTVSRLLTSHLPTVGDSRQIFWGAVLQFFQN